MGKADETYIIPMNNSLSITLDRFYTETKVTFDPDFTEDRLILNGNEVNAKEKEKIQNYMNIVRDLAGNRLHARMKVRIMCQQQLDLLLQRVLTL